MPENIAEPLLKWYDKNKRILPWRDKDNAYYTWVSEIMLQQTRVEAVKPYFQRFIQETSGCSSPCGGTGREDHQAVGRPWLLQPCPQHAEKRLFRSWKNMEAGSPEDFETLLSLKGIGRYTAGAIASIAYGKKVPAVDGNVLRVYQDLPSNRGDIMKQSVRKSVENDLTEQMSEDENQGISTRL